jgi:hypothetical protein
MSAHFDTEAEFSRYLLVDDTDEDIGQLLTVLCESTSSRRAFPETFDMGDAP